MSGSGISCGVSSQAKPNIIPWSPAPMRSSASPPEARVSSAASTPCAMSGDCLSSATLTAQVSASKPYSELV